MRFNGFFLHFIGDADTCKASLPLYLRACLCGVVLQIFDVVMQRSFIRIYRVGQSLHLQSNVTRFSNYQQQK